MFTVSLPEPSYKTLDHFHHMLQAHGETENKQEYQKFKVNLQLWNYNLICQYA